MIGWHLAGYKPENQSGDKHVESTGIPYLDEGSNPSNSTTEGYKLLKFSNL